MQTFKWTVEFEIDETWVADGFELTEERAQNMIETELDYSYPEETAVRIIKSPSQAKILKAQGYNAAHIAKATA